MNEEVKKVTVEDMDKLVAELRSAREALAAEAEKVKPFTQKVAELEGKAVAYLEEMGRENYQTPEGTIYINNRWSVKVPASDVEKKELFGWLQEKGEAVFYKYATVNSASLNALYKTMAEEAEAKGEFFSIPGVGAPSLFKSLGLRKAKS